MGEENGLVHVSFFCHCFHAFLLYSTRRGGTFSFKRASLTGLLAWGTTADSFLSAIARESGEKGKGQHGNLDASRNWDWLLLTVWVLQMRLKLGDDSGRELRDRSVD